LQVAWDIETLMEAWLNLARETPWQALQTPGPVLGRTPLALAVDAAVGIEALTEPFATGWFHWPGNPRTGELGDQVVVAYEASIVETIDSRHDLLAFVGRVRRAWCEFVAAREPELRADPARPVRTPRGPLSFVELLEAQRLHCAQHYRQASTHVDALGHPTPQMDLDALYGLRLPVSIY
jgi:hypothetical protein